MGIVLYLLYGPSTKCTLFLSTDKIWVLALHTGVGGIKLGVFDPFLLHSDPIYSSGLHEGAIGPPWQGLPHLQVHASWWEQDITTGDKTISLNQQHCLYHHTLDIYVLLFRHQLKGNSVSYQQWDGTLPVYFLREKLFVWQPKSSSDSVTDGWYNTAQFKVGSIWVKQ